MNPLDELYLECLPKRPTPARPGRMSDGPTARYHDHLRPEATCDDDELQPGTPAAVAALVRAVCPVRLVDDEEAVA